MILIKENLIKKRSVYKLNDRIRKYHHDKNLSWIKNHAIMVASVVPNYIIDVGEDCTGPFIDMEILVGQPANTFEHTTEFIKKIYNFCLKNIEDTNPYAHGDWVLSNMFIDKENIRLCDWDNIGVYSKDEILDKLHSDLYSAFGKKFFEVINDSASI